MRSSGGATISKRLSFSCAGRLWSRQSRSLCPTFSIDRQSLTSNIAGGDGLVLARHLWHFGYRPTLFYPKETQKELYQKLKLQCIKLGIEQIGAGDSSDDAKAEAFEKAANESDVIVDAIFGAY